MSILDIPHLRWPGRPDGKDRLRAEGSAEGRASQIRLFGWKIARVFLVPLLMVLIAGSVSFRLLRQAGATATAAGAPAEVARQVDTGSQIVLLGMVLTALTIALAAWLMSSALTRSMRQILLGMDRITRGSLGHPAEISGGGGLSEFATWFNDMVQTLSQAQARLERSSRVRQLVLEHLSDGVLVVDREGRLVFTNRAAEEMLGPSPVKVPITRWAEWYGLYLSDGKTLCDSRTMPLVLAMQGVSLRDLELHVSNPRVTGARWVTASVTPIADEDGGPWGGIAVLSDITGHRQAQHALSESEEKFRSFVETTYEWIWSIDREGKLTYSNPAVETILGHKAGELAGRNIIDLVQAPERQQFSEWLKVIADEGKAGTVRVSVILRWVHQHGAPRWIESNAVSIRDSRGVLTGYRGTSRDITLRQMAEDEVQKLTHELRNRISQLDAANHELEAFSYSVSHDLRAPLRSIDGFSQALLEDYNELLDAPGKDYLRRVRAASQRMAMLIDDLLKLSRVARTEISRSDVNLTALAEAIAANLRESQPGRTAVFLIRPELFANADSRLVQIVMENLLGNAWKFTRNTPDARIEVGLSEENGEQAYFVRDNGVGFDMQYAGKLFGAFQRLHAMDEFEGTGIGLATVQRIVHRHGGRVWARAAVNEGAAFYFTLS